MKQKKFDQYQKAKQVLAIESDAVAYQINHLDASFFKACEMIRTCTGRVVVMGIGKSGIIGRKLVSTLASTGTPSFFLHPVETLHGDMGMLMGNDIVIALSYSGETAELNNVFPFLRTFNIPLITMTARPKSRLGKMSDVIIRCTVKKEACRYNIVPTASTIAMMALGDALCLIIMESKGFKREDFAQLHPGGTLGKKLTMTVEDLMHQGKDNPHVRSTVKVLDAIFTMTRGRLGATNVIDTKGKLIGFFTDGDLRRHLQKDQGVLNRPIRDVMTKKPCAVRSDMLASEAAEILRTHKFDNLPVIDAKGCSIGIIDERDLMAQGIT